MSVFPDIASTGLSDIRLYCHVPGAYGLIAEYWKRQEMCTDHETLWYFSRYTRKRVVHTVLLAIRPADKGCADIQVRVAVGEPPEAGIKLLHKKGHRMTGKTFLGMFKELLERKEDDWPGPFYSNVTRRVTFPRGALRRGEVAGGSSLRMTRLRLEGSEDGLVKEIEFIETGDGVGEMTIALNAMFLLTESGVDETFFKSPVESLSDLSDGMASTLVTGNTEAPATAKEGT